MKRLAILICACAAAEAFAAVPGTYTARDYVQNGLVAQWDGREFGAYDVHAASSKYWADLVGRRNMVFNNIYSYTADGVRCDGNSVRWATSYCGDFSCFEPSADGITVEIAATIWTASSKRAILTAQSGTGVAILAEGGNLVLASAEKGATPVLAHGLSATSWTTTYSSTGCWRREASRRGLADPVAATSSTCTATPWANMAI